MGESTITCLFFPITYLPESFPHSSHLSWSCRISFIWNSSEESVDSHSCWQWELAVELAPARQLLMRN